MTFEISRYMNPPEPPVEIGKTYIRSDILEFGEPTIYRVLSIEIRKNKFYAFCEYNDEFTGDKAQEWIYAYSLEKNS